MLKHGAIPPTDGLEITVDHSEQGALVRLNGRLGIDSSPDLRDRLLDMLAEKPPRTIIVDLTETSYIDVSGIATLIEALKLARNRQSRLCLKGLQGRVFRFFEVSGLLTLFTTSSCRDDSSFAAAELR